MTLHNLPTKRKLFENRIIDPITGCWLWTGNCNQYGYGKIWIKGKYYLVHRISWQEFVGPIKELILHQQSCPNKHCFNYEHLYDGNHYTNQQDRKIVGSYENNITPRLRQ